MHRSSRPCCQPKRVFGKNGKNEIVEFDLRLNKEAQREPSTEIRENVVYLKNNVF